VKKRNVRKKMSKGGRNMSRVRISRRVRREELIREKKGGEGIAAELEGNRREVCGKRARRGRGG
jgi:hypothetical protein